MAAMPMTTAICRNVLSVSQVANTTGLGHAGSGVAAVVP